jgi:hypothetical protein
MKRRKRAMACLDLAAAPAQVPFEIMRHKKVSKRLFSTDLGELGRNRLITTNAGY